MAWTADGKDVVYSFSNAGSWANQLIKLRAETGAQPLTLGFAGQQAVRPAISRRGNRLAYIESLSNVDIWQIQLGKPPRSFVSSTRTDTDPQYAPDGKHVVFASDRSGMGQIWVCDQDGGNQVQLTFFNTGYPGTPRWSPDGRLIAFDRVLKQGQRIFLMAPDGGHVRRLTPAEGGWDEKVPSWSGDGRWIYYASDQTGRNEIWKAPAEGGEGTQLTRNGGFVAFESRDGHSLYYIKSDFSGIWELPLGGGRERLIVKSIYGRAFCVTDDGLYYIVQHLDQGAMSIRFRSSRTGKDVETAPVALLPEGGMSVSPDKKTFLVPGNVRIESNVMVVDNFR